MNGWLKIWFSICAIIGAAAPETSATRPKACRVANKHGKHWVGAKSRRSPLATLASHSSCHWPRKVGCLEERAVRLWAQKNPRRISHVKPSKPLPYCLLLVEYIADGSKMSSCPRKAESIGISAASCGYPSNKNPKAMLQADGQTDHSNLLMRIFPYKTAPSDNFVNMREWNFLYGSLMAKPPREKICSRKRGLLYSSTRSTVSQSVRVFVIIHWHKIPQKEF